MKIKSINYGDISYQKTNIEKNKDGTYSITNIFIVDREKITVKYFRVKFNMDYSMVMYPNYIPLLPFKDYEILYKSEYERDKFIEITKENKNHG